MRRDDDVEHMLIVDESSGISPSIRRGAGHSSVGFTPAARPTCAHVRGVGHVVWARNTLPTRPEPSAVFDLLLPRSTRRLIVYPAAIDTRWGPERLRAACERDLGVELDRATAVLFYNRTRDTLVLYTLDSDGDRCIKKKLVRGTFLVPVPAAGQKYVVVDASKISKLFRGPGRTDAGRREAKNMKITTLRPKLVEPSPIKARPKRLTDDELAEMIEEATVDAYGPSEQVSGFFTKIEEHLDLPFSTKVLGVDVVVEKIDLTRSDEIVAICKRGRQRQTVSILDLLLPTPAPKGAAWIEAYRHWARNGLE